MAKFNVATKRASVLSYPNTTRNFEGGIAFKLDDKVRLYTRVCTSLIGEDKFYQEGTEHDKELINDIHKVAMIDPEFILKLAAYARNEMYLRSAPIVLLGEAAFIVPCKPFVRKWTPYILRRADEPGELIAYWVKRHGDIGDRGTEPFPNSLKKGISDALHNFDEYQFEKYDKNTGVKYKDILCVCHSKPKGKLYEALFRYYVKKELDEQVLSKIAIRKEFTKVQEFDDIAKALIEEGHITWEVALSKFGNKKEVWEALDLPFMAMLRNLRNMLQAGVDMTPYIRKLTDKKTVLNSKQLPFRFFAAYRELERVENSDKLLGALSEAIEYSIENIPRLEGTTLIACDNSGSMDAFLSRKSSIKYRDIANLFGAMSYRFCDNAITGSFGTDWRVVSLNPRDSIFTNMDKLANAVVGHATNAYKVFDWLINTKTNVDRIILFSDMQCYDSRQKYAFWLGEPRSIEEKLRLYRNAVNPNTKLYSVDLAGYGTSQVPQDDPNTAIIAGWSERIFDFIYLFEQDKTKAISIIENYTPKQLKGDGN